MDANGRKWGLKRAESGRETTKCSKNAKFWSGKGKNEAQRGWAAGTRFQIGGVGRGCIPGGIWIGKVRRPSRQGGTSAGATYNRSGGQKSVKTVRKRPKMAFLGVWEALEGLKRPFLAGKQEICRKTGGNGGLSCFPVFTVFLHGGRFYWPSGRAAGTGAVRMACRAAGGVRRAGVPKDRDGLRRGGRCRRDP